MPFFRLRRALARLVLATLSLTTVLAIAVPEGAIAQGGGERRVVVERFRGPRASRLRAMLITNLEDAGWTVIPEDEVRAAERSVGVRGRPSDDDYVQMARELRAVAFLSGSVSRARRSWRLVVRVRNGADGQSLGSEGWGGRTTSAMDAIARNGASRLEDELAQASAPGAARTVAVATTAPGEEPWYQRREVDDEVPGAEEEEETPAAPRSGRYDSFRLSLSGGSVWRSMQTVASVYAIRRGEPAPDPATTLYDEGRGYTSSGIGHAELGVEAELYPGALGDQVFPWLGLLVSFRHSVFLTSYGCRRSAAECAGDGRVQIGTDQLDVQAGLRGRYRFGEARGDFQIMIEILWGMSTFTLDTSALQEIDYDSIIPPMEYQYLGLGGGFEFAAVPDALVLAAHVDYRPGLSIGAKSREVWGIDTGPASGFLIGAEIRHEATWLAEGAFAALRLEYFQFVTDFRGQVGCATPGGCPDLPPDQQYMDDNLWEPWPVDGSGDVVGGIGSGVADHYVRWGLYLGYAFR